MYEFIIEFLSTFLFIISEHIFLFIKIKYGIKDSF